MQSCDMMWCCRLFSEFQLNSAADGLAGFNSPALLSGQWPSQGPLTAAVQAAGINQPPGYVCKLLEQQKQKRKTYMYVELIKMHSNHRSHWCCIVIMVIAVLNSCCIHGYKACLVLLCKFCQVFIVVFSIH